MVTLKLSDHPARYTPALLPLFKALLEKREPILDVFAGTGERIRTIRPDCVLLEIEREWAAVSRGIVADAMVLPFPDRSFSAICTSPTYGNRMADHHRARDGSRRITYTHVLGHRLSSHNSGAMQFGEDYCFLHRVVWQECWRVLERRGILVLNVSDHIRHGKVVPVSQWHKQALEAIGFRLVAEYLVKTQRMRYGQNGNLRVDGEYVYVFKK